MRTLLFAALIALFPGLALAQVGQQGAMSGTATPSTGGGGSPSGSTGDLQTNAGSGAFGHITPGLNVSTALAAPANTSGGLQTYDANLFKRNVNAGAGVPGSGNVIPTGLLQCTAVPFSGTITGYTILSPDGVSGSTVIDVWKSNAAVPTVANTITASAKPTLSSATYVNSTTLTGWTTSVAANDVFCFNVNSVASLDAVSLILFVTAN